ncbi:endolytic transglycosylase MltG [Candidatus Daviesbacteria bacterium]|nr:endolytic transglycosylase MltG [Candidatus Daviesbacteria bacterium]
MRKIVLLVIFLLIAFGGLKLYRDFLLSPKNSTDSSQKLFIIKQGSSTSDIAKELQKEGFIRSANAFTILVRSLGTADKIQAGAFKLSASMSAREILQKLQVGRADKWVTIPEGFRVEEIAARLSSELSIKKADFLAVAKEGYMFPDTYLISPDAGVSDIAQMMRDNFDQKYDADLQTKIKAVGLTPAQGVILASIVEREARSDEARRMVGSILLKRFKIGMGLNTDATIQYILGYQSDQKSWWKKNLTKTDLATPSAYNTYIHAGLPPTPIANPGLSSLQAVANANPTTPYLYYYHDSKGISHYGRDLDEHNENVANYP